MCNLKKKILIFNFHSVYTVKKCLENILIVDVNIKCKKKTLKCSIEQKLLHLSDHSEHSIYS